MRKCSHAFSHFDCGVSLVFCVFRAKYQNENFLRETESQTEPATPYDVSYNVGYGDYDGAFAMQKDSRTPSPAQLIIHCAMGMILGALMALILIVTNRNIFQLIASSSSPSISMAMFVGFFSFVVGTGATMSGFIFTAIELGALEAKQQTKRVNRPRDR